MSEQFDKTGSRGHAVVKALAWATTIWLLSVVVLMFASYQMAYGLAYIAMPGLFLSLLMGRSVHDPNVVLMLTANFVVYFLLSYGVIRFISRARRVKQR